MNQREIDIEQLMIERLAGVIGPEDECHLEELLNSDDNVYRQWEGLKNSYDIHSLSGYLEKADVQRAWENVKNGIGKREMVKTKNKLRFRMAAIIAIPVMLAGFFIFRTDTSSPAAGVLTEKNAVRLILDNKHTINLSMIGVYSTIKGLTDVKIDADHDSLVYVSLNNNAGHSLNTLIVPKKATYKITLNDGTQVWLNSMSQLNFPSNFSNNNREVWVTGEAYFKVTKNPHLPFIVHTPLTEIKVLGTEFNVNAYDSSKVVTALIEGKVDTKADKKTLTLKPGYEAVFTKGSDFKVASFDKKSKLAWMQGVYYFQNATLKDIASIVNRWYGDSIVVNNLHPSVKRFSGAMFKNRPLTEFLDNLSIAANIHYYSLNGKIYIDMP